MKHHLLRFLVIAGIGAILAGARCANPCIDLSARVCEDLGPTDCAIWQSDPAISEGILPGRDHRSRRAKTANMTFRIWVEDHNYRKATLPLTRWRIANARDPGQVGPPPSLEGLRPPPDALGIPSFICSALGPLAIFLALGVGWLSYRRMKRAQSPASATIQ